MPIGQIAKRPQHLGAVAAARVQRPETMNFDLAIRADDELHPPVTAAVGPWERKMPAAR